MVISLTIDVHDGRGSCSPCSQDSYEQTDSFLNRDEEFYLLRK